MTYRDINSLTLKTLFTIGLYLGFPGFLTAASSSLSISGRVSPINTILVEDLGLKTGVLGKHILPNTEVSMMKFRLSNNNPNGFYVNFSSQNQGKLIADTDNENPIAYTIFTKPDMQPPGSRLGTDEPNPLSNVSLENDTQLLFNTNVTEATRDRAYILSIVSTEIPASSTLYSDIVTITIHNL
jgi:hypothetical protein